MKYLFSILVSLLASKLLIADKPNFVFIYADDMGWTGTSVEMIPGDARTKSDYYHTPNIEKLASMAKWADFGVDFGVFSVLLTRI